MRAFRRKLQRADRIPGLLALVCFFAGAVHSFGQSAISPQAIEHMRKIKAPEDWTLEERLAVRFDPGDMSLRRQADRELLLRSKVDLPDTAATQAVPPGAASNSVVGQRNPELFLPTEIFDSLIQHAFLPVPEMRESYRRTFEEGFPVVGFSPKAFWPALTTIARETIQAHTEYYEVAQRLAKATAADRKALHKRLEEIGAGLCAKRAVELAAARQHFGRKSFDKFLYRAVAPTMFQVMSPDSEWRDQLRTMEEGCHATKPAGIPIVGIPAARHLNQSRTDLEPGGVADLTRCPYRGASRLFAGGGFRLRKSFGMQFGSSSRNLPREVIQIVKPLP